MSCYNFKYANDKDQCSLTLKQLLKSVNHNNFMYEYLKYYLYDKTI